MRAVGYGAPGGAGEPGAFEDLSLPDPVASARDLLVEVRAVSVNPVDVKRRASPATGDGGPTILGYDASGVVRAVGSDAVLFRPGDEVFYAGSISRSGSNAELQLVDERIVGPKPRTLDWGEAAALPLTSLTAWEALFDRIDVRRPVPGAANAILLPGGGGGVPSIAIQLLRALTDLTIIASGGDEATFEWVRGLGAHHVVDYRRPLAPQIAALEIGAPAFVFTTNHSAEKIADIADLIAPQGRVAAIDEAATFDVLPLKAKSVSLHWEFMFTRSTFGTSDMDAQGKILREVAELVDAGRLRTTLAKRLGPIDAATMTRAHAEVEGGHVSGKLVVEGWYDRGGDAS